MPTALLAVALVAPMTQLTGTSVTSAAGPSSAKIDKVNTKELRDNVTVGGILAHERVFQRIANQNGGTRASGTSGNDASAAQSRATAGAGGLPGA